MFRFLHDKHEKRIFINYVVISVVTFLILATINFGLIAQDLAAVNIIIPFVIGIVVGSLLGYNKLLRLRLTRSNSIKSQFLSSMNHELRTPMNAIIGFANLLNDSNNLTAEQKEEVACILQAGKHTTALIAELLDFAKIETGNIHLEPIELQAANVMLSSISMVKNLADENNVTIEHDADASQNAIILADEVRLTEVFVNILSNAIKYNKPGGTIKITYRQDRDRFLIQISDSGIGIDKAQMPYLFEPFNRLGAEKTEVDGTGVGLSISLALVEMMNGALCCDSEYGKGTNFTLQFPLPKNPGH